MLERDGDVRVLVQPKLAIKPYGPSLRELSELLQVAADPQVALASRLEELRDRLTAGR